MVAEEQLRSFEDPVKWKLCDKFSLVALQYFFFFMSFDVVGYSAEEMACGKYSFNSL